jgi:hypothetical protein
MDYLKAGLIVGALGDMAMQCLAKEEIMFVDMKPYFEYQGPAVSIVKASLLTGGWSYFFKYFHGEGDNLVAFVVFAGALDVGYRYAYPVIYPSLKYYYESYPALNTVVANMGVAALVYSVVTIM